MELKCIKCNEIFELNTDNFKKEQIDKDNHSIQYSEYGAMACPKCDNTINVLSYDYWIDNINNQTISGTETIECDGAKIV